MRIKQNFNSGWYFLRQDCGGAFALAHGTPINLPHTWNAQDGQDGGNDFYRGTCWYVKTFAKPEMTEDQQVWLEFEGAAMTAEVFLNGHKLCRHEGGYSTFRVNLTECIQEENLLAVSVDNSKNETIYPQKADFTFYGGIYRDVNLLTVSRTHFELGYWGSNGVKVTPVLSQDYSAADVTVEAWIEGDAKTVEFCLDGMEETAQVTDGYARAAFTLKNVHLWNGVEDPFLYTLEAKLPGDRIEVSFGCRSIGFDPDTGFILNGKNIRLCGAARHQDRQGMGNALTAKEHEEDMMLMREMGCNTIRLAHYQHSQFFYDLCDRYGMIVWAEIPYITEHMKSGRENTLSQMRELILQNYNHPSIVCWGLSNEITAASVINEDLIENHRLLNDLCHRLDATRPTVMAHAFMLDPNDPFAMISDIRSYNLYYGWYMGELEQNDQWFDEFRENHPDQVIGLSEYGADANPAYQNGNPEKGDWSEPYQALYHEHLLKMWQERPYIWAMHCWNMFDFAADGRAEGGKPGRNQKGLVTFDRKIKKDAFYIYKAYLSKEPFVHVCGSRYVDRPESETEIKVYSNQKCVSLYVDGRWYAEQKGDKVFTFRIPIFAQHAIEARSGDLTDRIVIRKVAKPNPAYASADREVINWFDKPEEMIREGYYSIFDTMAQIKTNPEGARLLMEIMATVRRSYGEVAQNVKLSETSQRMLDKQPFNKVLKQAGKAVTPAMVKELNAALNQIPKQ